MDAKTRAFAKDLAALLEKHEASLSIMLGEGSDTHGLYDEGIGVQFLKLSTDGIKWRSWTDNKRLVNGYSASARDIKSNIK